MTNSVNLFDGVHSALAFKAPCVASSGTNITLSGLQTVGGVALAEGDRVLVRGQTNTVDNGIWVVSTGVWSRSPDFDGRRDAVNGTLVYDAGGDAMYRTVCTNPYVPGSSVLTFQRVFFTSPVSVLDFGAVGDGVTDDTAAITTAYATIAAGETLYFPPGRYAVTTLTFGGSGKNLYFDNSELYGVAQTAQDQIVRFHNYRQAVVTNITVGTDGAAVTPVYQPNYGCAIRLTSDNGSTPTQFVNFYNVFTKYLKAGIVHGNLLGDAAQPSYPQSEINVFGYKQRGVMQPFYGNATNGYITFYGAIFVPQQFEASGTWWNGNDVFAIRNDVGGFVSVGGEYQVASQLGNCIYGGNILISDPILEHSCPNYITGDVKIIGNRNGFFGSSSIVPFIIDPAAVGELTLAHVLYRRSDGTATSSRSLFVDCENNDAFKIRLLNSTFKEWAYLLTSNSAHFVLGGDLLMNDVYLDNTASSVNSFTFSPNYYSSPLTGVDRTGFTMVTTLDAAAKGGYTATATSGGFGKYTASLPAGYNSAIRISGNTIVVVTPSGTSGIPVQAGKDYLIEMWLIRLGTVSSLNIQAVWYDYAGVQIGSAITVYTANDARMDADGFDVWQKLRVAVKSPNDAQRMRIAFTTGASCDIAFTDLVLR